MTTKQQTRGQVVAMFAPRRISSRVDPGPVEQTIRVSKTVEFTVPITTSAAETVEVAQIMAAVPGGLTFWSRMRVNSIKVWGAPVLVNADPQGISVQATGTTTGLAPSAWVDVGTPGAQRAHVAFVPGLQEQSTWHPVASTQGVFNVRSAPPGVQTVLVQASVDLLSPILTV
jgi:hypothetical protein